MDVRGFGVFILCRWTLWPGCRAPPRGWWGEATTPPGMRGREQAATARRPAATGGHAQGKDGNPGIMSLIPPATRSVRTVLSCSLFAANKLRGRRQGGRTALSGAPVQAGFPVRYVNPARICHGLTRRHPEGGRPALAETNGCGCRKQGALAAHTGFR